MIADITVFNPNTIVDTATFDNPHQYAIGSEKVILKGKIIIDKDNHTDQMEGQILQT